MYMTTDYYMNNCTHIVLGTRFISIALTCDSYLSYYYCNNFKSNFNCCIKKNKII